MIPKWLGAFLGIGLDVGSEADQSDHSDRALEKRLDLLGARPAALPVVALLIASSATQAGAKRNAAVLLRIVTLRGS